MSGALIYSRHPRKSITLNPEEKDIIASEATSIHVFWVEHTAINPETWAQDRQYVTVSQRSAAGVFVMYQSSLDPLSTLGSCGDLWVTESSIYIKEEAIWSKWSRSYKYQYPSDANYILTWSRNAELKYLKRPWQESHKWKSTPGRVKTRFISQAERSRPAIATALQKSYSDLTDYDVVVLLNSRCNNITSKFSRKVSTNPSDVGSQDVGDRFGSAPFDIESSTDHIHDEPATSSAPADPAILGNGTSLATDGNYQSSNGHHFPAYCMPSQQPTYQPFPVNTYQTPPDGRKSSGSAKCWNDMYMSLPYSPGAPEKDPDVALCQCIAANSTDATASTTQSQLPLVMVVETPQPESPGPVWQDFISLVKRNLAMGRIIVVRNAERQGPQCSFDANSVQCLSHRNPDGARIQWHSALKNQSNPTAETVKGTVNQFFAAASNKDDRVNCLDMPIPTSRVPYLISQLASEAQALSVTDSLGFAFGAMQISSSKATNDVSPPPNTREGGNATKRARPTCSSAHTPSEPSKKKQTGSRKNVPELNADEAGVSRTYNIFTEAKLRKVLDLCDSMGMKYIEWDAVKTSAWALLSSSGSFTGTHQDAAGYFTYVVCEAGAKFWCYVNPKDPPNGITDAMKHLFTVLKDSEDTETVCDHADLLSLILTPGTMVIQPSGAPHMVYTLEDSVFTGGHFYMLDGMHLVEATRSCAAFTEQSATNASHPGCLRALCRISLSILLNYEKQVLRKPFISLSRMILWPEIYAIGDVEPGAPPFPFNDESNLELKAAQAAVEAVLSHNSIALESIRPKDLKDFEWLAHGEVGEDWKDPGTSTLTVPDLRRLFRAFDDTT